MWPSKWMATTSKLHIPPGWTKSLSLTGKQPHHLEQDSSRDHCVPGFYLLPARSLFGVRLTRTQYSGFGGGVNAAFASFGRRHVSLAVSGTTSICWIPPLLLTCRISSVGAGPLAAALQSFTARR